MILKRPWDVHRDTVVATVRRPGPGGARRSETRTFTNNRFGPSITPNCAIVAPPGSVPTMSGNVWVNTTAPIRVRNRN